MFVFAEKGFFSFTEVKRATDSINNNNKKQQKLQIGKIQIEDLRCIRRNFNIIEVSKQLIWFFA